MAPTPTPTNDDGTLSQMSQVDWSENASWRTRYSSLLDLSLTHEGAEAKRSLSALSVMTAESIDYDGHKEADFKPHDCYSHSSFNVCTAAPASPKYLVPGDTRFSCGDVANRPSSMGLHASSSMFSMDSRVHDVRVQREPRSYYQLLDMNRDPVDLTPRLANVPSQYHMREMFEFSSLHSPKAFQTLRNEWGPSASILWTGGATAREVTSEYCTDI